MSLRDSTDNRSTAFQGGGRMRSPIRKEEDTQSVLAISELRYQAVLYTVESAYNEHGYKNFRSYSQKWVSSLVTLIMNAHS